MIGGIAGIPPRVRSWDQAVLSHEMPSLRARSAAVTVLGQSAAVYVDTAFEPYTSMEIGSASAAFTSA